LMVDGMEEQSQTIALVNDGKTHEVKFYLQEEPVQYVLKNENVVRTSEQSTKKSI